MNIIIILIIFLCVLTMFSFSKKVLASSIGLAMMTSTLSAFVWAEDDITTLPAVVLQAQKTKKDETFANGQLKQQIHLGPLGNKKIVDTPFTIAAYSEKLIQEQQAATVAEVLKNDPSIRITTNQGHLN